MGGRRTFQRFSLAARLAALSAWPNSVRAPFRQADERQAAYEKAQAAKEAAEFDAKLQEGLLQDLGGEAAEEEEPQPKKRKRKVVIDKDEL